MARKEGDLDCEHKWVYSNEVVLTSPMTFTSKTTPEATSTTQ